MSAHTLRAPARWHHAAVAELGVIARSGAGWWLLLVLLTSVSIRPWGIDEFPFEMQRTFALLMFLMPLAWHRAGHQPHEPLPLAGVRLDLLRVTCGAVVTTALLASGLLMLLVTSAGHVSRFPPDTVAGLPRSYPAALLIAGAAQYLFGAAVLLLSRRPSHVLPLVLLGVLFANAFLGTGFDEVQPGAVHSPEGYAKSRAWTSSLTVEVALVRVALAVAAVAAAAVLSRVLPRRRLVRVPPRAREAMPAYPLLGAHPVIPAGRVPRLWRVGLLQFRMQAPRMLWLLVAAAFTSALWGADALAAAEQPNRGAVDTGVLESVVYLSYFFPILVWMNERQGSTWDGAQPCGALERRLLHAAAGLAWLMIALAVALSGPVAAALTRGWLGSLTALAPAVWLGIPAAAALMYGIGTLWTMETDQAILGGIGGWMVTMLFLVLIAVLLGFPTRAGPYHPLENLTVARSAGEPPLWFLTSAVWLGIGVLAAVVGIRHRLHLELHGETAGPVSSRDPGGPWWSYPEQPH